MPHNLWHPSFARARLAEVCVSGVLQSLVHECAASVVLGLDMALDEPLLLARKAREAHRGVMLDEPVVRERVDVERVRADVLCHATRYRENEHIKNMASKIAYFSVILSVCVVHGEIREFHSGKRVEVVT